MSKYQHAPKKPRGYVAIGKIDRTRASIKCPDDSMLALSFLAKHPTDMTKPIFNCVYKYNRDFNWENRKCVKQLNDWRDQIRRRNFERVRKSQPKWVERERDTLLELVEAQLKSRSVPAWSRLANDFNTQNKNVIHRVGEKHVHSNHNSISGKHLIEDRPAPWRIASAIIRQSYMMKDFAKILKDGKAKAKTDQVDSDDDAELSDPTPGPPPGRPTPAKKKRKVDLDAKSDKSTPKKQKLTPKTPKPCKTPKASVPDHESGKLELEEADT
jgi:hypothetical protein